MKIHNWLLTTAMIFGLCLTPTLSASAISVNALPWAEVWVDGAKVGETPIGNFPIAVGTHDLVFKHPDFGERHESVIVTLTKPARISVDLRKP